MAQKRAVIAMSGGVDSSLAAALLVESGYDVVGIMLRLWSVADDGHGPANRCCALDAQYDAQRVADQLDIPFYVINIASEFKARVVEYFVAEYAAARTPNPCVECNRQVRFDLLLRRALALNADFLATGHYARTKRVDGKYQLLRGIDRHKDQSYILHVLGQKQLEHTLFPVGSLTKNQVRAEAKRRRLPVADRQDSQDLCFVSEEGYGSYLAQRLGDKVKPGPITNTSGRVLGEHRGLIHYTIGQRKGINVGSSKRLYVVGLEPDENSLVVGTADELGRHSCLVKNVNWVAGHPPSDRFDATAKIRYKARDASVSVSVAEQGLHVAFDQPLRDITPGQALVLYDGEQVLGGGSIY
jgi:tRNA-specific 2-thiouridylase